MGYFVIGAIIGACLGILVLSLLIIASDDDSKKG